MDNDGRLCALVTQLETQAPSRHPLEALSGRTWCWLRDDGEHTMWNLQNRAWILALEHCRKFRIKLLNRCR